MKKIIKKTKSILASSLANVKGWKTNRKIVVIESDDWGSIRMPSKQVYNELIKKGIRVDNDPYNKYDSLATKKDLEALFEVLSSIKDKNGRSAVLTANTITANPDFEKIKASGFSEYHYVPFTEILNESSPHVGAFEMWKQGINERIFIPQFHGREHLNVKEWMAALKLDHKIVRLGFDYGLFGFNKRVDPSINTNFMGAFNSGVSEDIEDYKNILREGVDLFKQIFGYTSKSFIAPTYTWHPDLELALKNLGVEYLQGMIHQRIPLDNGATFKYKKDNYLGNKSKASGLNYLMRNCYFEPSQKADFDWVGDCLCRVQTAFLWSKPATISMHRLNVIGAIDERNRERNLSLLKQLLNEIVKRYPDVEFMSSNELGELIFEK